MTTTNMQMRAVLEPLFKKLPSGSRVLDLGAGDLAFRSLFPSSISYISADLVKTSEKLDFVCDAENLPFEAGSFDYVLCSAVLEHTKNPEKVLKEILRVLKDGGGLFLTVPHFHYLHGEPHDYWRFTKYGILYLAEKAGFKDLEARPVGGAVSFVSSIISPLFLSIASYVPLVRELSKIINYILNHILLVIDGVIDCNKKFALGYTVIGKK